jgi:uncharacterized protein (DUF427 family)
MNPESVWDYPRPPRVEPCRRRVRVEHGGTGVADSERGLRVLETASPPTIYVPAADVRTELLTRREDRSSFCEWKGAATYFDLVVDDLEAEAAVWTYLNPRPAYARLAGHYAFYPGRVDAAWLDDERVTPQGGSFYGGWVTSEIQGPWKGEPGTEGW